MECEVIESRRKTFYNKFAANFGKLTREDGLLEYLEWIDKPHIMIKVVTDIIEDLAIGWERTKKPTLALLKRAYANRLSEQKKATPFTPDDCEKCGNSGKCYVVEGYKNDQYMLFNPKIDFERLRISSVICDCWHANKGMLPVDINRPWQLIMDEIKQLKAISDCSMNKDEAEKIVADFNAKKVKNDQAD